MILKRIATEMTVTPVSKILNNKSTGNHSNTFIRSFTTTASTNFNSVYHGHRTAFKCYIWNNSCYNNNSNTVTQQLSSTTTIPTNRFISSTKTNMEKIIVKVPTMGDSITEGTIVEWTAVVGQAVQPDDVVALIETDKVTIEIKADVNGVITQYFGSVDETVEVGAKLYEIDTDATASVIATTDTTAALPVEDSKPTTTDTPQHAATTIPNATQLDHRLPSIKFLGKDGWEALKKGHSKSNQAKKDSAVESTNLSPNAVTTIVDDMTVKDPMYGRPKFTEAEIEALLTGGATQAPQVISHSTGAKFKL